MGSGFRNTGPGHTWHLEITAAPFPLPDSGWQAPGPLTPNGDAPERFFLDKKGGKTTRARTFPVLPLSLGTAQKVPRLLGAVTSELRGGCPRLWSCGVAKTMPEHLLGSSREQSGSPAVRSTVSWDPAS